MWFGRIVILFGLLCGFGGTQAPEFIQQYSQRLGGAIDEIKRALADFDHSAATQGLTRDQGAQRLEQNADPLAKDRGSAVLNLEARENRLEDQMRAMDTSGYLGRLIAFGKDFDPQIASQAMHRFVPAVPVSLESAASGAAGFLMGFCILHGVAWPIRRRRRRRPVVAPWPPSL